MSPLQNIVVFFLLSAIECTVYIESTENSESVEFYDCIYHQSVYYCRRPEAPIALQRDNKSWNCSNHGLVQSFRSLWDNDVDDTTVLFEWKSGVDIAEDYFHYLEQPDRFSDHERYVCQCTDQSFGKNCEYLLPVGNTFAEVISTKLDLNLETQKYGVNIVCYTTLECDFGLVCLDWRDICDGIQNCMFGRDEENCDKLEFNECEDDEYRCMNGMCIPDEFFLDGEYDCMDMSDEKDLFSGSNCPLILPSFSCDDRVCPPNTWSCGDGQCIDRRTANRMGLLSHGSSCVNQRDHVHFCEIHPEENLWTSPDGRCYQAKGYDELNANDGNVLDYCHYLLQCTLTSGPRGTCPCGSEDNDCGELLRAKCASSNPIQYPRGAFLVPYIFEYFRFNDDPFKLFQLEELNGTIKCRGNMVNFFIQADLPITPYTSLSEIESILCLYVEDGVSHSDGGYHLFCQNDSTTFNHQSYSFMDVCEYTQQCISSYRIHDGFPNCKEDETQDHETVRKACSKVRRHRFRCSEEQTTCFYANKLGDLYPQCDNAYDESWMGTDILLAKIQCNFDQRDGCQLLRRYIENSWKTNAHENSTTGLEFVSLGKIPFRAYCDTFWDLSLKRDENTTNCHLLWKCPQDHWQCSTGQCIYFEWVLDGEWDCPDASDEENIYSFTYNTSHHNYQWLKDRNFRKNFIDRYIQPLSASACNLSIEYPCLPVGWSPSSNNTRLCIDLEQIGNGQVDCMGGRDEHSAIDHCERYMALGNNFICQSTNTCISYSSICTSGHRCPDETVNEKVWCDIFNDISATGVEFKCQDGTRLSKVRCDEKYDCRDGEDELWCDGDRSPLIYRSQKLFYGKMKQHQLQLPRFPIDTNIRKIIDSPIAINPSTTFEKTVLITNVSIFHQCHRGIGVFTVNNSIACFCPPQYHGDQCQYHSDRISVFVHLNLTKSNYTRSTDKSTVLKTVVLFLFENEVLGSDEYHIRPAKDIDIRKKKQFYFSYSRSSALLERKRQRYFNRSSIITEQPYSILVELYEMQVDTKPSRVAVWKYPIHFDFLPVYRFSKVLRLTELSHDDDHPCVSKPCNANQDCYRLMNDPSQRVCPCKSDYYGPNCTYLHSLCRNNYCSNNALCHPRHRTSSNDSRSPYCLCPINHIGKRCKLVYTVCSQNPCKNGGTCFQRSRVGEYGCECTAEYVGTTCDRKKESIQLHIQKHKTIDYQAIVVQYFNIDYSTFKLLPMDQKVYSNLPDSLFQLHGGKTAPEIILIKAYVSDRSEIYLISLQIGVASITGSTWMNDENQCRDIRSLRLIYNVDSQIPTPVELSYHRICDQNRHDKPLCFHDSTYLCVCEQNRSRTECFGYDLQLDRCDSCLSGGQCVRGSLHQTRDFLCLCPYCHQGSRCEFSLRAFGFTLDSLLSAGSIGVQSSFVALAFVIFAIGLFNNLCSFVTFKRHQPRKSGVGNYLFILTIVNQCALLCLLIKFAHILLGTFGEVTENTCKIVSYFLSVLTRTTYWLTSWITVNRLSIIVFPRLSIDTKSWIAILSSIGTILILFAVHIHEIIAYTTIHQPDSSTILCVTNFKQPSIATYNQVNTLVHYLVPFFIQLIAITFLIVLAARRRAKTSGKTLSFRQVLRKQFRTQKELYITPSIIALSALPQFILSFTVACTQLSTGSRYALLAAYIMSYAPQVLGFLLYVLPSSFYKREFAKSTLGKHLSQRMFSSEVQRQQTSGTLFSTRK